MTTPPSEQDPTSDPVTKSEKLKIEEVKDFLKSTTDYLTQFLPLANAQIVDFFTEDYWHKVLPKPLRRLMDGWDKIWNFEFTLNRFWDLEHTMLMDNTELGGYISNCCWYGTINNFCLSIAQLQDKITSWGGKIQPEINVNAFMNSKKSKEVATMSRLVASLYGVTSSTCCLEAGGGRGHLLVALSMGYHIPSLTVDCDEDKLNSAMSRIKSIQEQWQTVANRGESREDANALDENRTNTNEVVTGPNTRPLDPGTSPDPNLHRFACTYLSKDINPVDEVEEKFPELTDNVKLLLTGLHTCGDQGPSSLRIFASNPSVGAVFNVPCCYHHITEDVGELSGFPMSKYLKNYRLGCNARMLAEHNFERIISERQLPPKTLLFRAWLQVLIKKYNPDANIEEAKLKQISSECEQFDEYFKEADAVLNLGLYNSLPKDCLAELCKDMDAQWRKLVKFYLMKICLAPIIENLILLDRLMFLLENDFEKVFIVKLFDPLLSPRSHAIVAVR